MTDGGTASLRMMKKSMGETRSDVRTVECYPTNPCVMSTSPVIWVRLGGVHLDYVRIRSPLEYVDDLIHQVLVEYQPRINSRFEGNMIGTDCIKVYFQGPNSNPEPGVEQLVKHDVKLSKVVGLNPCAYFRMEVVDPHVTEITPVRNRYSDVISGQMSSIKTDVYNGIIRASEIIVSISYVSDEWRSSEFTPFEWVRDGRSIDEKHAALGSYGGPTLLQHFQSLLPDDLASAVIVAPSNIVPLNVHVENFVARGFGDALFIPKRIPIESDVDSGLDEQMLWSSNALCFIEWKRPSQVLAAKSTRQSVLELLAFSNLRISKPFVVCTDLSSCIRIWRRVDKNAIDEVKVNSNKPLSLNEGLPIFFQFLRENLRECIQSREIPSSPLVSDGDDSHHGFEADEMDGGREYDLENDKQPSDHNESGKKRSGSILNQTSKEQRMMNSLLPIDDDEATVLSPEEMAELHESIEQGIAVEKMCRVFPSEAERYRSAEFRKQFVSLVRKTDNTFVGTQKDGVN